MPPLNRQVMIMTARRRLDSAAESRSTSQPSRDQLAGLIEPLCDAICRGHEQWRRQAFFRDVTINGPTATGGTLAGPDLGTLIRTHLPGGPPEAPVRRYGTAIAAAVGGAWSEFQESFSVPGLPWYPTFAAMAGPAAPPTPNVPTPLSACVSDRSRVTARILRDRMSRQLGQPDPVGARLFGAMAEAFETVVTQWMSTQMVMNVMGKGPVPSFAPPHVPVGPVVMGDNLPVPGHLSG